MTKDEVIKILEDLISKNKGVDDPRYMIAMVEAIKTLMYLKGWKRKKPENMSGVGGSW